MDKEWKQTIIAIAIVAIVIAGGFACVKSYSGLDNSLTVVVSGSMQHGDRSQIGVIDTGDMIVMKNKDKGITTYVDGYSSGYKSFGEYGDVIIYNREHANPVIHRVICYIEFNSDQTMRASLPADLEGKVWRIDEGSSIESFTKISFNLPDWNNGGKEQWLSFSKGHLTDYNSGYLTKGDANPNYDQSCGIAKTLIGNSQIKAVAGLEIPWIGAVKLYIKGNAEEIQAIQVNTPYCLAFVILDILALIVVITIIWEYIDRRKNKG